MLLLTWHGTVVGLQEDGGGLLQLAPGETVPGVRLLDLELPASRGTGQPRVKTRLGALAVAVAPGGRGVTLARYGQFLCAERSSPEIAFSRDQASLHETFLPLTEQDLADLVHLLGHAWTETETGRTIGAPAVLADDFRVRLGGREVDLAAWLPLRPPSPLRTPYEPPRVLTVDFGGKLLELVEVDEDGPGEIVAPPRQAAVQAPPASILVTDPDVQAELTSWALAELSLWRLNPVSLARCEEVWASLNQTNPTVFLFHFSANTVTLIEKPQHSESTPFYITRVNAYLQFFDAVAAHLAPECDFKIAVGLADRLILNADVPLFSFQKTRGARTILLPDIDFLVSGFHEDDSVRDTLDFSEKASTAIFVGATTGGAITEEIARTCTMPRLRAAKFFNGHPRIDFFLPAIVQCNTPEARKILEEMPFCQEQRLSWQEQFTRRFLISIDGNGATCSRVAISLRSNSVLVKYASAEMLYYFHGLKEWLHYVPVEHDRDLELLLDLDRWSPHSPEEIARCGRMFAQRFLTRDSITAYAVTLLSLYSACFTEQAADRPSPAPAPITRAETTDRSSRQMALIAHVQNTGDCVSDRTGWAGSPGTSHAIEGFQMSRIDRAALEGVACQGVLADGSLTPPVLAGAYCGTRGKGVALYGYILTVQGRPAAAGTVTCEGRFADASHVGPLDAGELCRSPSGTPLTGIRICVEG